MSKRLLLIFALVCGMFVATASSVMAQDLRPEDTFFLKPRIGISNYMGDNEKSPFNFNGDAYEAGFPFSVALELGYQFSVPFSVSLAYQYGDYPVITQFPPPPIRTIDEIKNDPTSRSTIQLFGRYTFANARTKTALFIDFGLAYSFGDVLQNTPPVFTTEESGSAFGPLLGIGLDIAINDKTSFFIESVSGIHLSDTELDANDTNGFGGTDILTGIGFGLKFNFKSAFTPVVVGSVNCPGPLTVGEDGPFTATANDDVASQPVEYRWDFGDGTTATGLSASHSYAQAGTYTVTFTATNSGSTDSGTCTVRVIAPAEIVTITANKTTVSTCDADPSVSFSANVRGDAPLTYNWDFGDDTTSTQANPSHTYANTGTYTVTLTLSNSAGSDSRSMTITVTDAGCFDCDITQMNSVFFDRNSSVLTPEARQQLMENVEIFRNCPNINARLEGYASRDERNTQKLSEDRARAVEQFYIDNEVAANRLTAIGMGATGQTTKKGGASQFRRVDTIPTTDPVIEGPEVPEPEITTPSPLPNTTQGQDYSTTLTATDGQPPLTWSGSPPAGLSLNAEGVISGTPNASGTFNFSVTVTDDLNRSDTETFQLTVDQVCVTHTVSLQGFAFNPSSLTINACDTVTWVHNDGNVPHTVTSGNDGDSDVGALFDSSGGVPNPNDNAMREGDTFSHTFNDAGTVPYHCRIHGVGGGTMTGTIIVNPNN